MPIQRAFHLQNLTQIEFDALDRIVMRHAYASQNKFGRLFDERVYENDLAMRLRAEGLDVHTQVPVKVTLGSFEKTYYLDLVVNHMLYELKVVATLLAEHKAQALHYAMLHDIRRVKLINFRAAKVQGELHYNPVTDAERYEPRYRTRAWNPQTPGCEKLILQIHNFIADWGTHLDGRLYNEALVHHFGGETGCLQRIRVNHEQTELGSHLIQSHAPDFAFVVTSLFRDQEHHLGHLQRLVKNLGLQALQWINLNRAQIELTTITR
jgi:GxxExxY protein